MSLQTRINDLAEVAMGLLHPWFFMGAALTFLPGTLLRLAREASPGGSLLSGLPRALASWPRLQDAWFGDFWAWAGPQVRQGGERCVVPLLRGRVRAGAPVSDDAPAPHPPVSGTVIEVGPGSGMWVSLFKEVDQADDAEATAPAGDGQQQVRHRGSKGVTKVYGVEPNTDVHDALRRRVTEAGLDGVYEVVPRGIEDLAAAPAVVEKGSVDCVVCILCLCGIPEPRRNMAELYGYLRPGGRMYIYEHVKYSPRLPGMALYQAFINLFWPHILGGCQLRRETGQWLREAGPWASVDLASPSDEQWYGAIPHIIGVLTK